MWQVPLSDEEMEGEFVVWHQDVFAGEEALHCCESGVCEAYYEEYHHCGVVGGKYH